jgi:hypothetical protein
VFVVAKSGHKGASRPVLAPLGAPEWSPFGFTKQFLEEVFSETKLPVRRLLGISEGRLFFVFAHYQNRAVCVSDDAIGYTPHQRSSYSAATAAACYYQTCSYFLG